MDEATELGPLATPQILRRLCTTRCAAPWPAGARLLTGGKRLDRPGNYYAPTVLTNVPESAPAFAEELFGPVAALFRVPRCRPRPSASPTPPRSASAPASGRNDAAERDRFIDEIEAGMVFVNAMVASDPRLPFGGVKHSGYGRELGAYGIREFVNIKTVWIREGAGPHTSRTE